MDIEGEGKKIFEQVKQEIRSRAYRASNELRNASQMILRGQRTGRRYRVPFTGGKRRKPRYYTASAPGEAPANRTGALRASWRQQPRARHTADGYAAYPAIESPLKYAHYLDKGTARIAKRPFSDPIKERAKNAIKKIYQAPYTLQ